MEVLWQDLRYGARVLLKNRSFTLIALLTLGLGIGVTTALFAGFNLLLRPNPIKDPETVVKIERQSVGEDRNFSYLESVSFRKNTQTLTDILPTSEDQFTLTDQVSDAGPLEVKGVFTSENYLSSLGGEMELGGYFTRDENHPMRADAEVVLSHYFWRRRFAEAHDVVGRTILLNEKPFTVIGVTGREFVGLQKEAPDVWLPLIKRRELASLKFDGAKDIDWVGVQEFPWLNLHARLRPGKTLEQAQSELSRLQTPMSTEQGGPKKFISVAPAFDPGRKRSIHMMMTIVLCASGLVLLIACSNVANMLLARGAARQKEIGVRMALGADRRRVMKQLMTECFLLAISGGVAGLVFAWWSVQLLFPWVIARSDGRDFAKTSINLSLDWRALLFALALSILSGLAFGLVPALRATRPDLVTVINNENAAFGGRLSRFRLRNALVVAQVALCLVLLIPAGLLARAAARGFASNRGFEADQLLTVDYVLSLAAPNAPPAEVFHRQMMTRLAAIPGVQSVCPQADDNGPANIFLSDGRGPEMDNDQFQQVPFHWVTEKYFETIGTPILLGRNFTREEVELKKPVIIISESTSRNLWGEENPVGKTMRIDGRLPKGVIGVMMASAEIIGVAGDNQLFRAGSIPPLFLYAPQPPWVKELNQALVRTPQNRDGLKEVVRKEALAQGFIARLGVGTMDAVAGETAVLNITRIASELALTLGSLALVLATLGLYGVMAFTVAQRGREIGVRLAMGAQPKDVQWLVIGQGMKLVLYGGLIGVPLAASSSQLTKSLLSGLSTLDPITYAVVPMLLAAAGLLACWLPARRAARINPINALRMQ